MEEDERLKPILLNVEKQYIGKDYGVSTASGSSVRASDVDQVMITIIAKYMRFAGWGGYHAERERN